MYDQSDAFRFCQGDQCFVIGDDINFNPSWVSLCYYSTPNFENKKGVTAHGRSCLGVYECPEKGCAFVANPVVPTRKNKHALPLKPKKFDTCSVHKRLLVHKPCKATWKRISHPPSTDHPKGHTVIEHVGTHYHKRPHESVSKRARNELGRIATTNKKAIPTELTVGLDGETDASSLHPSLINRRRVEYEMKKARQKNEKEFPKFDLKDLVNWEDDEGEEFLVNPHIGKNVGVVSICFPGQKEILRSNDEYCWETDALEGWIQEPRHPDMTTVCEP